MAGDGYQYLPGVQNRHRQLWALQLQLLPAQTRIMSTCLIAFLSGVCIGVIVCGVVVVLWAATTLSGRLAEQEKPLKSEQEEE